MGKKSVRISPKIRVGTLAIPKSEDIACHYLHIILTEDIDCNLQPSDKFRF